MIVRLAVALALLALPAAAEENIQAEAPADATVLARLHHANQMEMDLGQLAKLKGATREVRAFGDRLTRDHLVADRSVIAFAKRHATTLSEVATGTRVMRERLESLTGADFDREFLASMAEAHGDAIAMIDDACRQPISAELKTFLEKLRPILEQHRTIALALPEEHPTS